MTSKTPPQPTLKFERLFNATPEKLWSYWTEPLRYARWMNPAPDHGLVIHEWDLRVGGKVRFDMPQPDGNPNPQEGVFHVLNPFSELVSGSEDKSFLLRVTFEPVGKQTRMRVEVTGVPPQHHADATKGFNACFDKLTQAVETPSVFPVRRTYAPTFAIERTFKAPVEKLWAMWTTKAGLEKWYWPEGLVGQVKHLDLRIGGGWEIAAEGLPHTSRGTFTDIVTGQRLGMVAQVDFLPDVEPYERIDTIEFTAVPGGSRLVLRCTRMHDDQWNSLSAMGWTSSLNKLAQALEGSGEKTQARIVGRSVHLERVFKAPPAKVWAAWSTAPLLEKWFWPAGKGKVQELDFRPGGRLVMAHEAQPWKATWEYVEIVPEKRIVIHDLWDDGSGHRATGTIEFHAVPGGTKMVVTHGPFPEKGPYKLEDAVGGFSAGVEKLAALVEAGAAGPPPGAKGFTIERTFRAPPEKVWAMWTTQAGIEKWWAPSAKDMGYDMRVLGMDVRVGGRFAFELKKPEHTLVNQGVYVSVKPHTELAWVWHFDIFLGPGEQPYDVPISVTLQKTATGGTRMTFVQGPLATPEHTEGSRQGVLQNIGYMAKALGE